MGKPFSVTKAKTKEVMKNNLHRFGVSIFNLFLSKRDPTNSPGMIRQTIKLAPESSTLDLVQVPF